MGKWKEIVENPVYTYREGIDVGMQISLDIINEALENKFDSIGEAAVEILKMKLKLKSTDWK